MLLHKLVGRAPAQPQYLGRLGDVSISGSPSSVVGGPSVRPPMALVRLIWSVMSIVPQPARFAAVGGPAAVAPLDEGAAEAVASGGEFLAAHTGARLSSRGTQRRGGPLKGDNSASHLRQRGDQSDHACSVSRGGDEVRRPLACPPLVG